MRRSRQPHFSYTPSTRICTHTCEVIHAYMWPLAHSQTDARLMLSYLCCFPLTWTPPRLCSSTAAQVRFLLYISTSTTSGPYLSLDGSSSGHGCMNTARWAAEHSTGGTSTAAAAEREKPDTPRQIHRRFSHSTLHPQANEVSLTQARTRVVHRHVE